mmetsp:Transcript_58490/g.127191  ORF Transcript_58490/g.127191 Transcript_58490/m.127191 type:complete len:287 (-) Transcript_58490:45-905(-)
MRTRPWIWRRTKGWTSRWCAPRPTWASYRALWSSSTSECRRLSTAATRLRTGGGSSSERWASSSRGCRTTPRTTPSGRLPCSWTCAPGSTATSASRSLWTRRASGMSLCSTTPRTQARNACTSWNNLCNASPASAKRHRSNWKAMFRRPRSMRPRCIARTSVLRSWSSFSMTPGSETRSFELKCIRRVARIHLFLAKTQGFSPLPRTPPMRVHRILSRHHQSFPRRCCWRKHLRALLHTPSYRAAAWPSPFAAAVQDGRPAPRLRAEEMTVRAVPCSNSQAGSSAS